MHFGIFHEESRQGTSQTTALHETLELADAAEASGLDGVWLGEIHFNPARSVMAAPIAVASFIAARTRRLRVGTAVQVLPLGNPLRIAEEVATVDHLSQGRFEFGIGRSGAARTYDVIGIPYAESQARFLEALEIIRKAWTEETFSYEGKFYRFQSATVAPRPYQHPHPPIRMAANTPETFSVVGRLGLGIFVGVRDLDVPELRVHLESYRRGWRDAGHPGEGEVYLRIPVYAAGTEKEAVEEPSRNIMSFFARQAEIMRAGIGRDGAGPADRRRARAERLAGTSYDEILRTRVAFGTAAGLIDRFTRLREELGLHGLVAELNPGGLLAMEPVRRSLRILAQEVMPAFK
jgi:alkanesulfonate monooxygenase SsuD/methylene tetrahydromethanopterin reductase-like flavin-dependent oxidoreductase (luciferase family)